MNKIKYSFYLRLSIIISILIILIVSGISYSILGKIKSEYQEQIKNTSNLLATLIVQYSVEPVVMENYSTLYDIIDTLKNESAAEIMEISISDNKGSIMVSTNRLLEDSKLDSSSYPNEHNNTNTFSFQKDYLDVTAPINAYDRLWGFLHLRYSLTGFKTIFLNTQYQIIFLALIFIIIGLCTAFFAAKAIVKPVHILVKASRSIAHGNFHNPICINSRDEFGFLGKTLEEMRINLKYFVSDVAKKAIKYEGNIEIFTLPTLLRLLNNTKRTGGLIIKQENKIGVIYFYKGEIIDALLDEKKGKEAFINLFLWHEGDFKFGPDIKSRKNTIKEPFDSLLLRALRQVKNPNIFKQTLPTNDMSLVPAVANIEEITERFELQKDEKTILYYINNESANINRLEEKLGWPIEKISKILYLLLSLDLICVEADKSEFYLEKEDFSGKIIPFPDKKNEIM